MTDRRYIVRLAEAIGHTLGWRVEDFCVEVVDGGLILSGRVLTSLARALAEVESARIFGRPVVRNEIEIARRVAGKAVTLPAAPPAHTARSFDTVSAD